MANVLSVPSPNAGEITVAGVLELLDGSHSQMAQGVATARYAMWIGSGISRGRMEGLREVVLRVLTVLQQRIASEPPEGPAHLALTTALSLVLSPEELSAIDIRVEPATWTGLDSLLHRLASNYASLLDVRIDGSPADHLVWDVVDVGGAFGTSGEPPDAEHYALALLAFEGLAPEIASANWDGLIEAAAVRMGSTDAVLQVCVAPEDVRRPRSRSRLFKFHGCAIRAASEPAKFRAYLIARQSQINSWASQAEGAWRRDALVTLVREKATLMVGLSAQDQDIQRIFNDACAVQPWPWPNDPPAFVFAEDALQPGQRTLLQSVYKGEYDVRPAVVEEASVVRAYGKPLLAGLVLYILAAKLCAYVALASAPGLDHSMRLELNRGIAGLRNLAAGPAGGSSAEYMERVIELLAGTMSMFQTGVLDTTRYVPISSSAVHEIQADPHVHTSGLPQIAVLLGLLGTGAMAGSWALTTDPTRLETDGVLQLESSVQHTKVFLAANPSAASELVRSGIVETNDGEALLVHSGSAAPSYQRSPAVSVGRTGRRMLREVAMQDILDESSSLLDLHRRFCEESGL